MRRLAEYEGLRGMLSLMVVVGHINEDLAPWARGGMDTFFCLSGYLIGLFVLTASRTPIFLRNYMARRALRILPVYFVVLGFCLLATAVLNRSGLFLFELGPGTLKSLFLLQNTELLFATTDPALRAGYPPFFDHSWSVALEEQFYLVAPFVGAFLVARRPATVVGIVVAALALSSYLRFEGAHWWVLPARWDGFVLGLLLAYLAVQPRRGFLLRFLEDPRVLGAMTLAFFVAFWVVPQQQQAQLVLLSSLFSMILIANLRAGSSAAASMLCSNRILCFLGTISYSTYLWHLPVLFYCGFMLKHFDSFPIWLKGHVVFFMSFLVGYASYVLIERPFNRLKARFPIQGAPQTPASPPTLTAASSPAVSPPAPDYPLGAGDSLEPAASASGGR